MEGIVDIVHQFNEDIVKLAHELDNSMRTQTDKIVDGIQQFYGTMEKENSRLTMAPTKILQALQNTVSWS